MTQSHDEQALPERPVPLDGSELPPLDLDAEPTFWERPSTARTIGRVLWLVCLVLLAIEFFPYADPHGIEKNFSWFGFYAFYAVVAVFVMSFVGAAVRQAVYRKGDV